MRIGELRQKNTLRVQLRLLQLLLLRQPKLLMQRQVVGSDGRAGRLELVWDPLLEALEAMPCPARQRPTFAFDLVRPGWVVCSSCGKRLSTEAARKGRR